MGRRKFRDLRELMDDPRFPFMVGRLVGATEMTSHWLMLQEQPSEAKDVGQRLGQVVEWFFTEGADLPALPPPGG